MKTKGFTAIEFMIVLAIVAIFTAILIPALTASSRVHKYYVGDIVELNIGANASISDITSYVKKDTYTVNIIVNNAVSTIVVQESEISKLIKPSSERPTIEKLEK